MTYDTLYYLIQHFGYPMLFFALWLGIVGIPIPDEVIVLTGGAMTSAGLLKPFPAFLITYLGVISGLSIGFFLGKFLGTTVLDKIRRKRNMGKYFDKSEGLVRKYGEFALFISYFLPVVRHLLPYLVGINKMAFSRFALISYSTGFFWTLLFFIMGQFAGTHIQDAGVLIHTYGLKLLGVTLFIILILTCINFIKKSHRRS